MGHTIVDLKLSTRPLNCLVRYFWRKGEFINNAYDIPLDIISKFTYKELLGIKSLGKKSAQEIVSKMLDLGYEIKKQ